MAEKYQPTYEEQRRAELMMDEDQRRMTKQRMSAEEIEALTGEPGYLLEILYPEFGGDRNKVLTGIIRGHELRIEAHVWDKVEGKVIGRIKASIDDVEVSEDIARKLYEKYGWLQSTPTIENGGVVSPRMNQMHLKAIEDLLGDTSE